MKHINYPDVPFFGFPVVGGLAAICAQHGDLLLAVLFALPAAVLGLKERFLWE